MQTRNDVASPARAKVQAAMAQARGTEVESNLINPAMLQAAGLHGSVPAQGPVADLASPLALNNPQMRMRIRQERENARAARGSCIMEAAPEATSITGLADILLKKFPRDPNESASVRQKRNEAMFHYVQRRFTYGVIIHEMGHSIGLRHNFISSAAALHYRPQYWQLRTKNGKVTASCADAMDDGASCVGPRYWDPMTDEEQSQLEWMWMQSSVMDYAGEQNAGHDRSRCVRLRRRSFLLWQTVSVYANPEYQAAPPSAPVSR